MAQQPRIAIEGFSGLHNTVSPKSLKTGQLWEAVNVDHDDSGMVGRRDGYTLYQPTNTTAHSLWTDGATMYYRFGNSLVSQIPGQAQIILRSDMPQGLITSFVQVANRIYYSDGITSGIIEQGVNRTWGLTRPAMPSLAASGGSLYAGRYRVALSYVRKDGQESGLSQEATMTITDGGIKITYLASLDPTVNGIYIYASKHDGTEFYRLGLVANQSGSYTYAFTGDLMMIPARFITMKAPPAMSGLMWFNGRIFGFSELTLYWTNALAYELFDPNSNWMPFEADIQCIGAVEDGLYVGTSNKIWFLSESSYNGVPVFMPRIVADYGATGAQALGDSAWLQEGGQVGKAWHVITRRGEAVGLREGTFTNRTEDIYSFPTDEFSFGAVINRGGTNYFYTYTPFESEGAWNKYERPLAIGLVDNTIEGYNPSGVFEMVDSPTTMVVVNG